MELVLSAFGIGLLLSLILIGPVFFLLIETSLTKGWRTAIVLNLGVLLSDVLCILVSYFSSRDLAGFINTHPPLYRIGGTVVIIYGLFMFFSKPPLHINKDEFVAPNYYKTFMNGFLLNIINVGVIFFWFAVVSSVAIQYPKPSKFLVYMTIVLVTFFSLDLLKIFLAQKLQKILTDKKVYQIRKGLGLFLIGFGIVIFLKSYGIFKEFDNKISDEINIESNH